MQEVLERVWWLPAGGDEENEGRRQVVREEGRGKREEGREIRNEK